MEKLCNTIDGVCDKSCIGKYVANMLLTINLSANMFMTNSTILKLSACVLKLLDYAYQNLILIAGS